MADRQETIRCGFAKPRRQFDNLPRMLDMSLPDRYSADAAVMGVIGTMPSKRTIHVFIASPGDLAVERRAFAGARVAVAGDRGRGALGRALFVVPLPAVCGDRELAHGRSHDHREGGSSECLIRISIICVFYCGGLMTSLELTLPIASDQPIAAGGLSGMPRSSRAPVSTYRRSPG